MVSIPTAPTISCGIGQTSIAVVTTYKGGLLPISGVDVEFRYFAAPFIPQTKISKTTNILGLAEACVNYSYIEAWVKKTGIDFGAGSGNWKMVGSGIVTSPKFYKQESVTLAPGIAPPPITPPTVPEAPKLPSPITIQPPVIPPEPTLIPSCSQFTTVVDSGYPSHPSGITDFAAPFYVYIRGVKDVCKTDPTNPSFVKKVPKGTPGTVTLGSLSSVFYLTDDGVADIDLSKLMDLSSLSGAAPSTIPIVVQPPPPTAPSPTKTGRLGVPGVFYVGTAEVQSYLNQFFPGGVAEQGTGTWSGAYKITRGSGGKYPSGTYFWTVTWEDIKSLY